MDIQGFIAGTFTKEDSQPKRKQNQVRIIKFEDMEKIKRTYATITDQMRQRMQE